jgi:hypothetical protein
MDLDVRKARVEKKSLRLRWRANTQADGIESTKHIINRPIEWYNQRIGRFLAGVRVSSRQPPCQEAKN